MLPDWRTMPTDEKKQMVSRLFAAGLSASQVAARFQNCSRNAAIGLSLRMRVAAAKAPPAPKEPKERKRKPGLTEEQKQAMLDAYIRGERTADIAVRYNVDISYPVKLAVAAGQRRPRLRTYKKAKERPQRPPQRAVERKVKAPFVALVEISDPALRPKPQRFAVVDDVCPADAIPLVELTHSTCKWPVFGDGADTMFCGRESLATGSYCARHQARSAGRLYCEAA